MSEQAQSPTPAVDSQVIDQAIDQQVAEGQQLGQESGQELPTDSEIDQDPSLSKKEKAQVKAKLKELNEQITEVMKDWEFIMPWEQLENLISGNIPIEKLMITKALRSDYKNPESIGHNVLAERIGQRDPGNKPKSGDRIKFVFIVNNDKKALQGHRMETPEYIIENNIKIDYEHFSTPYIRKRIMLPTYKKK
jgi:hypothetical protein